MNKYVGAVLVTACIIGAGLFLTREVKASDPAPAATASVATTAPAAPLSDAQRTQIEGIVKDYISNNPQVVVDSLNKWKSQQQQAMDAASTASIKTMHKEIFDNPADPFMGNPKGDVTIVQFYDYNCHYCKGVAPTLLKLLQDDKNIRVVFKQFPILAESSKMAAQAAIAANMQGKFTPLHNALMQNTSPLTEDSIIAMAEKVGLDVKQLKKDANSDAISKEIDDTLKLGNEIGVRGTPGFIIADKLYPGAMNEDQFKDAISSARKGG